MPHLQNTDTHTLISRILASGDIRLMIETRTLLKRLVKSECEGLLGFRELARTEVKRLDMQIRAEREGDQHA